MRLPEPARSIARGVTECVSAARVGDRDEYQRATGRLATLNPEQVGLVLGAVVRSLLEDLHPDGLTGDDVQVVLERCARAAAGWFPAVDPNVLVVLLVGALGVHEPDGEQRPLSATDLALHAPLLIADLLALSRRGPAQREDRSLRGPQSQPNDLAGYLDAAFAEIARAESMDW